MSELDLHNRGDAAPSGTALRLALLSTPRSGNTWLRHLLGKVFAAHELAVHDPAEVDWAALPGACVLQLHHHRTPALESLLARHGFRVVVLARHPLDVLLSILHFATHDGATRRWLAGEAGDEAPLHGAMPGSASFLDYARGQRARALLSISPQWWEAPGAVRLRYEDLVAQPVAVLQRLVPAVGAGRARGSLAEAVADSSLVSLRRRSRGRHHFWQGRPGHWKRLLVAEVAQAIAAVHAGVFQRFGYVCDPDPQLSRSQADAHWIDLNRDELTEKLWHYLATRHELEQTRVRLQRLDEAAGRLQQRCLAAEQILAAAEQGPLAPGELARARGLLATGRQDLAAAGLEPPWKRRWLKLGRSLVRTMRQLWT
jgi:hypothetical protein